MSSIMALRRSPKPGAFTAQIFRVPRMRFTTRVASASLDVFGHEQQRLVAGGHDLLEDGLDVLEGADLLLVEQHVGVLEFALLCRRRS